MGSYGFPELNTACTHDWHRVRQSEDSIERIGKRSHVNGEKEMMFARQAAVLVFLLELTVSTGLGAPCSAAAEDFNAMIPVLVAQIRSERDRAKRYEAGDRLEKFVNDLDRTGRTVLAPEVVDEVASLLGDDDEIVRAYAAGVLAQIGVPAALRSVGPLLKALREAKSDSRKIYRATDYNATDAIIGALRELRVCVIPSERYDRDVCDYLLH